MKFFVVDAFTKEPFKGNPAGVVIVEKELTQGVMQQIASEVRFSETAFVRRLSEKEFSIRYFTPASEVDLCGHATIGTFFALKFEDIVKAGNEYNIETLAGRLKIKVEKDFVLMEQGVPKIDNVKIDEKILNDIPVSLGIRCEDIGDSKYHLSPVKASTGLWDLMIPVKSKEALLNSNPNFELISMISQQLNIVSFHVFTLNEKEGFLSCRDFAPLYGILEEPATGTANGALAYYLYKSGIIDLDVPYTFVQGESMNRKSEIVVKLSVENGKEVVYVGGSGKVLIRGEILI